MNFLIDRNLEGYAIQLLGTLANQGWLELLSIRFVMFHEVELAINSSDRAVWRFAQESQMILLTANRRMKGADSLEQTIREENTVTSLPVFTISSLNRFSDREYREQCAVRLVDILLDLDNYRGVGRVFIS
ncbi:MAG: ACP S-malonyltransferase [Xenococcaceae cyanobacterium]